MAAKDFASCGGIQTELDAAVAQRKELPDEPKAPPAALKTATVTLTPKREPLAAVRMTPGSAQKENRRVKTRPSLLGNKLPGMERPTRSLPPTGRARPPTSAKKAAAAGGDRTVARLRPKKPLILAAASSVLDVSKAMAAAKTDSALLTGDDGCLAGIVTSTDMMRRVVAKDVDPSTSVDAIMTKKPKCVRMEDNATDALIMMMDNHFRHLPVLDDEDNIVAVLDIAKCMYDAISKIEKVEEANKANSDSTGAANAAAMMKQMTKGKKMSGAQAAAMQAMLGPLMDSMFGGDIRHHSIYLS